MTNPLVAIDLPDSQEIAASQPEDTSPRWQVLRVVLVFQVKLAADGLRDLVLSPISILAAITGIALGGPKAHVPFEQVLKFGKRTERWIDLFGVHGAENERKTESDLESVARKVEDVIRRDYRNGGFSAKTRTHIDEMLKSFDNRS